MATKRDLLDRLEAAGVDGFSMSNRHDELAAAVADLPAPPDPHPNRERYESKSNRPHSVIGA